jgi:hypothetical protein
MSFEIEGKLFLMLESQSGEGQKGPWTKQSFVIETFDQYPKKVHLIAWNDKADILKTIQAGDRLKVEFIPESREYNGRWYTDLRAWRIETFGNTVTQQAPSMQSAPPPSDEPLTPLNLTETDDLPF